MRIIAIDPGMHYTGLAILDDGKLIWNTVTELNPKLNTHEKLHKILVELKPFLNPKVEHKVVIEQTLYRGKFILGNKSLYKIVGAIEVFTEVQDIHPMTVKSVMKRLSKQTDKGLPSKDLIKKAVEKLIPKDDHCVVKWDSEDAVDAVAIGLAYMEEHKNDKTNA